MLSCRARTIVLFPELEVPLRTTTIPGMWRKEKRERIRSRYVYCDNYLLLFLAVACLDVPFAGVFWD